MTVVLVATACASGRVPVPESSQWRWALLRAAIADAQSTRSNPISVDPRAIDVSNLLTVKAVPQIDSSLYVAESDATVAARTALLHEWDVRVGNAFPMIDDCQGLMKAPPRITSNCPQDSKAIVAFGLPFLRDDAGWAMHSVAVGYTPVGFVITVSELRFAQRRRQWVVDDVKNIMVIE